MDEKVMMTDEGENLLADEGKVQDHDMEGEEEETKNASIIMHELYEQGCAHPFPNSYTLADIEAQPVYASYDVRDHCFGRLKVKRKRNIARFSDASMFKRARESYHRSNIPRQYNHHHNHHQQHSYFSKPLF